MASCLQMNTAKHDLLCHKKQYYKREKVTGLPRQQQEVQIDASIENKRAITTVQR